MNRVLIHLVLLFLIGLGQGMAQSPRLVSGRVLAYLSNRIGDYDGFRVQAKQGVVAVYFPPHLAAKIRQLAIEGKAVELEIGPGPVGPGHPRTPTPEEATMTYRLIGLRKTSHDPFLRLTDWPPPPPRAGQLVSTEGNLLESLVDDQGRLVALVTSQYLIELKPHQASAVQALLDGVKRIGAVGYRRADDGFVNRSGRPVLHPTALMIKGQTYTL